MGLDVWGLRFDASGRGPRFDLPQAEAFKGLFCDSPVLDDCDEAHWPLALGAGEGGHLNDLTAVF
jgi:hypothetical protein